MGAISGVFHEADLASATKMRHIPRQIELGNFMMLMQGHEKFFFDVPGTAFYFRTVDDRNFHSLTSMSRFSVIPIILKNRATVRNGVIFCTELSILLHAPICILEADTY
jgi:hypothetical protein